MQPDTRENEQMARTRENISTHVTIEKGALGEKVWVVHDAEKLSPRDLQDIRDAATAKGAKVELAASDNTRSVDAPSTPTVKEQAQQAARASYDRGFDR